MITLLEDLQALGIAFVSLGEGIDCTTPAGRLQMQILGAISSNARIAERVKAACSEPGRKGNVSGDHARQRRPPLFRAAPSAMRRASGVQVNGGEMDLVGTDADGTILV